MKFSDVQEAVCEVRAEQNAVDAQLASMLSLIVGRLHTLEKSYTNAQLLKKLKRELRNFDAVRGVFTP